jgi:hypothetical protein
MDFDFVHPVQMGPSHLFLVIPLCLLVALVYKTVRVHDLRQLPGQVLSLWAYIVGGLTLLMVAFYLLTEYAA